MGGFSRSFEGDAGCGGGGGGCDFHWRVALTAPMPALYGFCLAVIGLETGVVGASVTVVDRASGEGQAEAAAGFLGFDKVSTPPIKFIRIFDFQARTSSFRRTLCVRV